VAVPERVVEQHTFDMEHLGDHRDKLFEIRVESFIAGLMAPHKRAGIINRLAVNLEREVPSMHPIAQTQCSSGVLKMWRNPHVESP